MAYTAHKDPEQLKERYDSEEDLLQKASQLVQLIRKSRYFIIFTGAGVSTSAGIPDFRGPEGVWTLQATGGTRTSATTTTLKAIPTLTHMSMVELQKKGYLKYVVSQNCDGLHRRSGILPTHISELHGNSNLEQCVHCGKEYLRDFDASASYQYSVHDHRTGRICVVCGGVLVDTIINFGENLPEDALQDAFEKAQIADLCLVLGSSLTVSPACEIPKIVGSKGSKGNLVICNLQNTPLDKHSSLRVYAKCDDLMKLVMEQLEVPVPPFILKRRICTTVDNSSNLTISAVDFDGTPASIFSGIIVNGNKLPTEPFSIKVQDNSDVEAKLFFFGHYNEPPITLKFSCAPNLVHYYDLFYNPLTGVWETSDVGSSPEFIKIAFRPPRKNYMPSGLKVPAPVITKGEQTGFSVQPKEDCPHIGSVAVGASEMVQSAFHTNQCSTCGDSNENWMCMSCGVTCCSRYVKGHASTHNADTGHPISISFSDLSVWCYKCDEYIKHRDILPVINALHQSKFGENMKK